MKYFLSLAFIVLTTICSAQKYVLIDKKMALPVTYTNTVTLQHDYQGLFAVEKSNIHAFISEVEKISKELSGKAPKPESFNFSIGNTKFIGLNVPLSAEDRLDIVLTTDCGDAKTSMHLSDAKLSNANNVYFINTWLKYIRSYVK